MCQQFRFAHGKIPFHSMPKKEAYVNEKVGKQVRKRVPLLRTYVPVQSVGFYYSRVCTRCSAPPTAVRQRRRCRRFSPRISSPRILLFWLLLSVFFFSSFLIKRSPPEQATLQLLNRQSRRTYLFLAW